MLNWLYIWLGELDRKEDLAKLVNVANADKAWIGPAHYFYEFETGRIFGELDPVRTIIYFDLSIPVM